MFSFLFSCLVHMQQTPNAFQCPEHMVLFYEHILPSPENPYLSSCTIWIFVSGRCSLEMLYKLYYVSNCKQRNNTQKLIRPKVYALWTSIHVGKRRFEWKEALALHIKLNAFRIQYILCIYPFSKQKQILIQRSNNWFYILFHYFLLFSPYYAVRCSLYEQMYFKT